MSVPLSSQLPEGSSAAEQSQSQPLIRRTPHRQPMPPDDMLRNSIAQSLTQILVHMTNKDYQQRCREVLEVEDLERGAHARIVDALEQIDNKREAAKRKPRTPKP